MPAQVPISRPRLPRPRTTRRRRSLGDKLQEMARLKPERLAALDVLTEYVLQCIKAKGE